MQGIRLAGLQSNTSRRPEEAHQMYESATVAQERPPESIPISNEGRDRFAQAFATGAPLVALIAAGWFAWGGTLHWSDISVALILYVFTGLGVTVGFHR